MQKIKCLFEIFLLVATLFPASGQKLVPAHGAKAVDTSFNQLVRHFDQRNPRRRDTLLLPTLFVDKNYNVVLADSARRLVKQRRILTNPFSTDKYPLSYSVVYQNTLISLFAPGHFACFDVTDWQRKVALEKQLNTKQFERHWIIDGHLIGLAAEKYWQFKEKEGWQIYLKEVPFKDRPKLFEDAKYLVYSECRGEFGGRIFFVDKQKEKTYWTESTCAVWVRYTSQGYEVLSNLGHGMGSADKQRIVDPHSLPEWTSEPLSNTTPTDDFNKPVSLFDIYGVQLFGGLEGRHQLLYLLHFSGRTCLASLSGQTFTVVDPLFNDGLYTHQPITTDYEGTTLINLDFYGIGRYREVGCLVLKNNQATLLDWHEFHSH